MNSPVWSEDCVNIIEHNLNIDRGVVIHEAFQHDASSAHIVDDPNDTDHLHPIHASESSMFVVAVVDAEEDESTNDTSKEESESEEDTDKQEE